MTITTNNHNSTAATNLKLVTVLINDEQFDT